MRNSYALPLFLFLLTGCTKSILDTNDARCPFEERGGCQSMEMVNRMVSLKQFTANRDFVEDSKNLQVIHGKPCKGVGRCWKK